MRTSTLLLFAMALSATTASAGLVCTTSTATSCTQVVAIPSTAVPSNGISTGAATFDLFGSIGAPAGAILQSVTLELLINESLTGLSVRNNSGTSSINGVGVADAVYFDAANTASASDGSLLDAALPNSLNLHRSASTVANLSLGSLLPSATTTCTASAPCSLSRTLTKGTGVITGTTSAYTGTGQFNLRYTASDSITLSATSGAINLRLNSVSHTSDATATVVYTFTTPTPEPASIALFAAGLLFLVGRALAERRLSRSPARATYSPTSAWPTPTNT